MSKKFYAIPVIKTEHKIKINTFPDPIITKLQLSFADGMFGVIPIFTDKRKAEKYAGKVKEKIIVFEMDST